MNITGLLSTILISACVVGCAGAQPQAPALATATPDHSSRAPLDEIVYVVRTQDEPGLPSMPAGCPHAKPDATFGARYFRIDTRADGKVVDAGKSASGTATACAMIRDATFSPGSALNFFVEFYFPDGTVVAHGDCPVTAKDRPVPGTVIGGCSIPVVAGPKGFVAGHATSSTLLNVGKVPGFQTGSYWTLRIWVAR